MDILLDAGFLCTDSIFFYRDTSDLYALGIYPIGSRFGLHIYQTRWEGFYTPPYLFSNAEAAALYGTDFVEDWLLHSVIAFLCAKNLTGEMTG